MRILISSDHAGFELKQKLIPFLEHFKYEVENKGAFEFDANDDYPDLVEPVAREVSNNPNTVRGIVIGGSGQGEAIVANRFPHVRAVVFNGQYSPRDGHNVPHEITISREHNNSNILSLGARFLSDEDAKKAVRTWLETEFTGEERHVRRLKKIDGIKP